MIEKINHYSLTKPATVYDEEALTALQLAGRTAAKCNEAVDKVNEVVEGLPAMVKADVEKHIENGAFDDQINEYTNGLEYRLDHLLGSVTEGSTTLDAEVIDARIGRDGKLYPNAGEAIRKGHSAYIDAQQGYCYLTSAKPVTIDRTDTGDGSILVIFNSQLVPRYRDVTRNSFTWASISANIADYITIDGEKASIRIPANRNLVFNTADEQLYIKTFDNMLDTYSILLSNGWLNPGIGIIHDLDQDRRINELEKTAAAVEGLPADFDNANFTHSGYVYLSNNAALNVVTDSATGKAVIYFGAKLALRFRDIYTAFEWSDIASNISTLRTNINATGDAEISINANRCLVFDYESQKIYDRNYDNIKATEQVLIKNGWANIAGGTLVTKWLEKRIDAVEANAGTETINAFEATAAANIPTARANTVNFMFFTDPHLCEGSTANWYDRFNSFKKQLKAISDAYNGDMVICGGDWLGNSDTVDGAKSKLAYINAQMMNTFKNYMPVLGNHDTNYQGANLDPESANYPDARIDQTEINNLVFGNGEQSYYKIDAGGNRNYPCKIIVLDSGDDWTDEDGLTPYQLEQLNWLCTNILEGGNTGALYIFVVHMFYKTVPTPDDASIPYTKFKFAEELTKIAQSVNNRSDYSNSVANAYLYNGMGRGRVGCIITGHNHYDYVNYENGVAVIGVTQLKQGDTASIDLMTITPSIAPEVTYDDTGAEIGYVDSQPGSIIINRVGVMNGTNTNSRRVIAFPSVPAYNS